ncbi:MAG: hypothetical protein V1934_00990 [Methanobacteriota archaeon]
MRMRALSVLVLLALGFLALTPLAGPASAAVSSVSFYIPGESLRFSAGTVPIMVAGVIHSIDVSLDAPHANVTIVCHPGATAPAVQDDTNYYSWACVNSVWSDAKYGMYVNLSQCSIGANNIYKFAVGMSARATPGVWNFTVYVDGALDWAGDVVVEVPESGFSLSRPDFFFAVSPFQTQSVSSFDPADQSFYVRANNVENVPLTLSLRFEPFGEYFSTRFKWDKNNESEPLKAGDNYPIFHPGEERFYFIDFAAPAWSPRELKVTGTVRGEPKYLITPATVALVPAFEQQFSINVNVQRTGYTLLDFGKVIVQYVKNVPLLKFGNSTTVDAYFTGEGSATLSLVGDNITITSATIDDVAVDPASIVLSLSNVTERHLRITIKAEKASTTAFTARIIYTLGWSDGGAAREELFSTAVTVDRVPSDYKEPVEINWMAIIAIVAVVAVIVGFMAYYSNLKKKEKEQRKQKKKGRGKRG